MALSPTLEAEGWSRITFDEWGELSLDDFGILPLGTSTARAPWHCSLKLADTVSLKLPDMTKINVHGGDAL